MRSDDYIDGLQVAYKEVFKLMESCALSLQCIAYKAALQAIDQKITEASTKDEKKIILIK